MLFPGAFYVIALIAALVDMALCVVLAFMVGSGTFYVAKFLRNRTNVYKRFQEGRKDSNRWWFNLSSWIGAAMIISFIIFTYTTAGPYWAFIKYLGGI